MAIGKPGKRVGSVGRRGKTKGPIGKPQIHGSALTLDQNKTKVGYPTTTSTTSTSTTTTTTS